MTLPATDKPTESAPRRSARFWIWIVVLVVAIGVPVGVTVVGALTSPPSIGSVPEGHIVFMEADEPSEHTSTLRGMYVAGIDGRAALLLQENEPQDIDAGSREWINQPTISGDGRHIAFEKQLITLQEEEQSIVTQIWVIDFDPKTEEPGKSRMLADLSDNHLTPPIGIAWTAGDQAVTGFGSDLKAKGGSAYREWTCSAGPAPSFVTRPSGLPEPAGYPQVTPDNLLVALCGPAAKAVLNAVTFDPKKPSHAPPFSPPSAEGAACYSVSPDGRSLAFVSSLQSHEISVNKAGAASKTYPVRWGWSPFGRRHISSLRWSPDGRYVGYSVSKPPVAEDELFVLDTRTGAVHKLPFRTGPASWDWGP